MDYHHPLWYVYICSMCIYVVCVNLDGEITSGLFGIFFKVILVTVFKWYIIGLLKVHLK